MKDLALYMLIILRKNEPLKILLTGIKMLFKVTEI